MRKETCCFTGHRKLEHNETYVKSVLKSTLTELINRGYCYFGTGCALGFDTIAALAVLELKKDFPHIKLILVLPCKNQTQLWKKKDIEIYNYIKSKCDKYVYTSEEYTKDCMCKRNRHLVDNSSCCVCYINRYAGGTAYTVSYARQKGLEIINIIE